MRLTIKHVTTYDYEPEANRVALRLRLFPATIPSQAPSGWTVTVNGEAPSAKLVNSYGDQEAIWLGRKAVSTVEVVAEGQVETEDTTGLLKEWRMAAPPGVFLRETQLSKAEETVKALAAEVDGKSGLERAHALSELVRDRIEYKSGATEADTTASAALTLGAGVCQDHAHVLIAASRALGDPARYVVGYLLPDSDQDTVELPAETHAWVEVWIDGLGWVGFDPTNRICPTDRYVRLASGLDANDAAPIQGTVIGQATQEMTATVAVAALSTQQQSQG